LVKEDNEEISVREEEMEIIVILIIEEKIIIEEEIILEVEEAIEEDLDYINLNENCFKNSLRF